MPDALVVGLAFVVGLILGSFGTVVAHRVPRRETFVSGRSKCPHCGHQITAWENIPLLSYLVLRGKCRNCGARISPLYPIIELTTGILFALAFAEFGATIEGVVYALFFWVLVVLTVIDIQERMLYDRIVYPTFIAGWVGLAVAALISGELERLGDAAIGALVFGGFFFLAGFAYPAGMGGGDIKLAFVLGTFLGYAGGLDVVLVGMFLSFLLGGVGGLLLRPFLRTAAPKESVDPDTGATKKVKQKTFIPFGPFLAAGTVFAILAGQELADAYLDML